MRFLRRAVLIPDDRVGWLPFAVATGLLAASRGRPDALYSTSYPHTAHVVAGIVHSLTSIPWIADFRDGWTQNPALYNPLTGAHAWLHRRLERWVARTANRVITVSPPITTHLQALRGQRRAAAETIYNGFYDTGLGGTSDFDFSDELEPDPDEAGESAGDGFHRRPFHLLYGGTFFGTRSQETLFKALAPIDKFR